MENVFFVSFCLRNSVGLRINESDFRCFLIYNKKGFFLKKIIWNICSWLACCSVVLILQYWLWKLLCKQYLQNLQIFNPFTPWKRDRKEPLLIFKKAELHLFRGDHYDSKSLKIQNLDSVNTSIGNLRYIFIVRYVS